MFETISDDAQRTELSEFYKENKSRFLSVAYFNLHNAQDAEDAVQETFRRIADKPESFFAISKKNRINYVYVIVRNVSVDMFRKKNKIAIEKLEDDNSYGENPVSLEDDIIDGISRGELKSFIKSLPPLQRDVLTLRCLLGLSVNDTAETLNISRAAVKRRLHEARKSIREFVLKEDEIYE